MRNMHINCFFCAFKTNGKAGKIALEVKHTFRLIFFWFQLFFFMLLLLFFLARVRTWKLFQLKFKVYFDLNIFNDLKTIFECYSLKSLISHTFVKLFLFNLCFEKALKLPTCYAIIWAKLAWIVPSFISPTYIWCFMTHAWKHNKIIEDFIIKIV